MHKGCNAGCAPSQMEFSALTARTGDDEFVTTADRVIENLHQLYPEQARPPHAGPASCHPLACSVAVSLAAMLSVRLGCCGACRPLQTGQGAQIQSACQASCDLSP